MKNLRTEEEIIANWKADVNKPVVSICCITFNHESYIKDALDGFLIQETDFPFEILIHDDASTDHTAEIIREYEKKYPKLIKPIYQTENQYSKGIKVNLVYNFSRAKGEYIAFCEGDDYWVDKDKLQKQYDIIIKTGASICFTNAYKSYPEGDRQPFYIDRESTHLYSLSEIVRAGGDGMPTASILIAKSALYPTPKWFEKAPVGDYFIQILGSHKAGAIYINDKTCVYRKQTIGSWTQSRAIMAKAKIEEEAKNYIEIFNILGDGFLEKEDASYALANELSMLSILCIKLEYYSLAKELSKKSWLYYKNINVNQVIVRYTMPLWFLLTKYLKIRKIK